jgi:adenosylcobinamide-GDP ribazoletransferase
MFRNFITALQFLTVFTVNKEHRFEEGGLARSMAYFPLVGFLIGVVLVYADKLFIVLVLPQSVAAFLIVVLSVLVTRALHVDGLADTFDGLMGGHDGASRLAIMKDSRIGTAGALGIVCVLFLKYLCLNSLFENDRIAALLTAPVLARWSQALMAFKASYSREEGAGRSFVGHLRAADLTAASVMAIGLCSFVVLRFDLRSAALFCTLICGVSAATYLARRRLVRKLGGLTGDAIGAVSELNEALALFIFVLLSGNG